MLLCNYGKGTYLYTGYSFFRQIPAGIHGALRLFANILATPKHRIIERIKFLKKVPIFFKLNENHLEEIAKSLVEIRVENNSYICHQGDKGHELYIIAEGKVDVIKEEHNAPQKIITTMSAGDFVGEFAILADIPRTASLRAHGDVRLFVMTGASFQQMLTRFPEMVRKILKLLVHTIVSSSR